MDLRAALTSRRLLAIVRGTDPEAALRDANAKFSRRFRFIEENLQAGGREPAQAGLEEMEALWQKAKAQGL